MQQEWGNMMDYEMEELILIVSELAQKYTGYESTSVTYERAQALMEAVLYCLEECRRSSLNMPVYQGLSAREQYYAGLELLTKKVIKIKERFNELSLTFEDFGVRCLHDTMQKGIPLFLERYDVKFSPQETILTLDYPVLIESSPLTGADKIYQYLCAIQTEQRFLRMLDRSYVIAVLEKYEAEYRDMIENICSILLTNTIGHIAVKKPLSNIGFEQEEYLQLSRVFMQKTVSDIETMVKRFIKEMISQFCEDDVDMQEYLCYAANDIAVRIDTAARYGRLRNIFVL